MKKSTDSRPAGGARAPFSKTAYLHMGIGGRQTQEVWDAATAEHTTGELVRIVADSACQLINHLSQKLYSKDIPYPGQMMLEEVIKELQKRV